jgi:serine/threonine-protein kinase
MAVAEGLLSREEAEAVKEEASRLGRNPMELLVERGRLSADTLASLRREATSEPARDTGEPARDTGEPHDNDATLQLTPREQPATDVPGFPVTDWKRYRCLRLLGQGGMGRVFLAHDTQLRRNVALKFVRDDDPDNMHRFISEARSQARVSHERVCQVYEVGEVQGRTYIAMQHIDGLPLNQLAKELPLEQKVLVMREVSEGVHAAHRAGLIHRDIKPSNIMVERSDSGLLKPYVMDFGLARDWKEGMTVTGSVMGTPHYMAPEQARGEVSRLDRRADVYSLGATLYHLLTGIVPIPGSNSLEVLNNISAVEPRPPRAVDKDIPADLEAIILKCMEKERSARYDSARALAEELERFLNGEPVLARSPGLWYRLRKRARKHKAIVAVASGALVLLVLAMGWAGLELRATKQDAARDLQAAELEASIEELTRRPYLLPLHDTSAGRERIQSKLQQLEAALPGTKDEDATVLHHALGRGYLALGEGEKALAALKKAWELKYRKPRVSYALVQALGLLYQEKLLALERDVQAQISRDASEKPVAERHRTTRKQQLDLEYRDPAVQQLEALTRLEPSEATPAPPLYLAALLAFHQERHDDAIARINEMGDESRDFYAALKLKGDILWVSATHHWNQGQPQEAQAQFEAARRAYVQATDSGRSDPFVHYALALLESSVVDMEIYYRRDSKVVETSVNRGLQAVARALKASPNHYESLVLRARLFRRFAEYRAAQGQDAPDAVHTAIAIARKATTLKPELSEARMELGRCYFRLGRSLFSRTEDPGDWFNRAQEILQRIPEEERDQEFYLLHGNIHKSWSDHEARDLRKNCLPKLDVAIASFRKMLQMNEARVGAWLNLASAYLARTQRVNSPDPLGDLEQAQRALDQARARNPRHILLADYEGLYHEQLAIRTRERGGDARPHWKNAIAHFQQGLAGHATSDSLLLGKGQTLAQLAQAEWDHGGETAPLFDEAQALFDKTILLAPNKHFAYSSLGALHAWRAVYQLARGENPTANVRASVRDYQQAITKVPGNVRPRAGLGRSWRILAEYQLGEGKDPSQSLEQASAVLHEALRLDSHYPDTYLHLAEVQRLQARSKARQRQARLEDFALVAATLQRGLDLTPKDQDIRLALGRLYRDQATWQQETKQECLASLELGLTLANALLQERPHWADALLLRASLTLARLEVTARSDTQALEQARKDIERALERNRHLAREAQHLRERFQKLLAG